MLDVVWNVCLLLVPTVWILLGFEFVLIFCALTGVFSLSARGIEALCAAFAFGVAWFVVMFVSGSAIARRDRRIAADDEERAS